MSTTTLVCIAFDPQIPGFTGCLGTLSSYEVTMSRVEREEATVLLLKLAKAGAALDAAGLRQLLRELRKSLTVCIMGID
jgi:hypothetical protein